MVFILSPSFLQWRSNQSNGWASKNILWWKCFWSKGWCQELCGEPAGETKRFDNGLPPCPSSSSCITGRTNLPGTYVHTVCTGHGKSGKSWNLEISRKPCSFKFHFPGLGSYGIQLLVLESHGKFKFCFVG